MARDILLSYAHGIELERATSDIDIAFAMRSWAEYEVLRGRLLAVGFGEVRDIPHRLLFEGTRVDILPFGGVEDAQHRIVWPSPGDAVMGVMGYEQARVNAVEVVLPGGESVPVVSLPGLAMLKIFAWQDRRYEEPPGKDAIDLWSILTNYLKAGNEDRLYSEFVHLLHLPDYDYQLAGAWMLGADMRALLLGQDEFALEALVSLIAREADPDGPVKLARDTRQKDLDTVMNTFGVMKRGLIGAEGF
jgi:predicted nucleotidyltransferase